MLVSTALVAWLAASVVSATHVHVIRSAHDSTTGNVANTSISDSSATLMDSSYYTYNSEERVEVPTGIRSILENIHAQDLSDPTKTVTKKITGQIDEMIKTYDYLNHDGMSEDVFFSRWVTFVTSKYPMARRFGRKVIFATLANHFKNDDLPRVLVAGTKMKDVEDIALKLLDIQVDKWLELKRDPADVFTLLQLHLTENNPILSKLFPKWVKFVESRFAESSTNANEYMLVFLNERFKEDYALANALIAGAQLQPTKDVARKLLKLEAKKWANDGRGTIEVFKRLKLEQRDDNLFENPFFTLWFDFVCSKHENQYHRYNQMFDVLIKQYQGDNLVSLMVEKAQTNKHNFARSLLKRQVHKWITDTASVEYVFDSLQLNVKDSNPLKNTLFSQWAKFVVGHSQSTQQAHKEMLDMLLPYFKSNNALVGALVDADAIRPNDVFHELLDYQYRWWKEEKKNANDVYDILELRKTKDNPFINPAFSAWVDFVKSMFLDDQKATETMLTIVGEGNKDKLDKFLADKSIEMERPKVVATESKRQRSDPKERPPPTKRQKEFDLNEA